MPQKSHMYLHICPLVCDCLFDHPDLLWGSWFHLGNMYPLNSPAFLLDSFACARKSCSVLWPDPEKKEQKKVVLCGLCSGSSASTYHRGNRTMIAHLNWGDHWVHAGFVTGPRFFSWKTAEFKAFLIFCKCVGQSRFFMNSWWGGMCFSFNKTKEMSISKTLTQLFDKHQHGCTKQSEMFWGSPAKCLLWEPVLDRQRNGTRCLLKKNGHF